MATKIPNPYKTDNLLIIFTRNPEFGKCKTRLAASIGKKNALEVYQLLLHHTVEITLNLPVHKRVFYSEEIWEKDIWDGKYYEKYLQQGEDLGQRMLHAFEQGFKDCFKNIIIIGSDLYDLSERELIEAFEKLSEHDSVIGPAEDGGYYLLGLKKLVPNLFFNKQWGTNTVFKDTLKDLNGKNVFQLSIKNDIDVYDDLLNIKAFQPFLNKEENDKKHSTSS